MSDTPQSILIDIASSDFAVLHAAKQVQPDGPRHGGRLAAIHGKSNMVWHHM
jgi:hypothetical protein